MVGLNSPGSIRFDRQTLGRFWTVARLMFVSEARLAAAGMLLLIVTLSLALTGLNVLRSYVDRDFMNALAQRDGTRFLGGLSQYAGLFAALVPVAVFYRYAEERLGLFWRNWLSRHVLDAYFENSAYYHIGIEREIDNPDQRIEEDIRTFTLSSLSFALILLNSGVALVAFVSLLWSISGRLMLGAIAYALVGSVATYYLGRPLIGLTFAQLRKDADYRYKLINVRDFAESIAFYRGQADESVSVKGRLADALRNARAIIDWSRNLGFLTNTYNYVLPILPTILVAPLYFSGEMEFGTVVQAGVAFAQVLGALSVIVVHFGTLSGLAAVTARVGSFWESIERARTHQGATERAIVVLEGPEVSFHGVTLLIPHHEQAIVRDLSLHVGPDVRLLVAGPSGSGKTSLLRLLGGLWSHGHGVVRRPAPRDCMFIPQRPYMPLGTFRHQFLYGTNLQAVDEAALQRVITLTGLRGTVDRVGQLDHEEDWRSRLSEGEQELFAFARVLIVRPRFLFLDEASSSLNAGLRETLYAELQRLGVRYISTGPRSQLDGFHTRLLQLDGEGGYQLLELQPLPPSSEAAARSE
jgi:vitamin B12/bleomycin/antimicrobial peptide transport system ATP-binding/permease protein